MNLSQMHDLHVWGGDDNQFWVVLLEHGTVNRDQTIRDDVVYVAVQQQKKVFS